MKAAIRRMKDEYITIGSAIVQRTEKESPLNHPGVPYIGLDDVEAHTTKLIGYKDSASMKSSAKVFKKGDVLYSRLRPYLNKVWLADRDGLCSAEFLILPPNDLIDAEFLKYRISSRDFVEFANSLNAGDRPRVDFKGISSFILPPFSLSRQRETVKKLDELFSELEAGDSSLKAAKAQLTLYRQSLLKQAFEGKLTEQWRANNPDKLESPETLLASIGAEGSKKVTSHSCKSWLEIQLGELCDYITSGSRGWAKYYADNGPLFIRAQNLSKNHLDLSETISVSLPEKVEGLRTKTQLGDLLIIITGHVGRCGYVDREIGEAYVSQHVALCRFKKPSISKYLHYFHISESGGKKQLDLAAYGAGKPGLNLTNIRTIKVPLCSIPEQQEIVRLLDEQFTAIEQNEKEIDHSLTQSQALRQSILKKTFSGKLNA